MAIHFTCEKCGHPIDVDDRFAGLTGHCKHCGHAMTVPGEHHAGHAGETESTAGGLRLRPVTGADVPEGGREAHHAPGPALTVRPLAPEDAPNHHIDRAVVDPDPIPILDPYGFTRSRGVPHRLDPHYETRLARFVARILRGVRDWLYLVSVVFLLVAFLGFLFKIKSLLHLGSVGVVASNILMLVDGVFYLYVVPFRDGLGHGLANLLLPPYTVYFWVSHWGRMKRPVINTLRSFTPILLVGLGYFLYEEAPAIREEVEQIERSFEETPKSKARP